ncbi:hypothetical protein D3C80_1627690 [compost metagenome]
MPDKTPAQSTAVTPNLSTPTRGPIAGTSAVPGLAHDFRGAMAYSWKKEEGGVNDFMALRSKDRHRRIIADVNQPRAAYFHCVDQAAIVDNQLLKRQGVTAYARCDTGR